MDTNIDHVTLLIDQINFSKEENNTKNTIIQILSENQSYLAKQSIKQELIFPEKVSQKLKVTQKILQFQIYFQKKCLRFATILFDHTLRRLMVHQKKDTKSLRESWATPKKE